MKQHLQKHIRTQELVGAILGMLLVLAFLIPLYLTAGYIYEECFSTKSGLEYGQYAHYVSK